MAPQDLTKRAARLRTLINKYRYQYHVENKLEISEEALDALKYELKKLEETYPQLITKDSPTQRVEGKVVGGFQKVTHKTRMLSLEDAFSESDMHAWEKRLTKLIPRTHFEYFGELKFDGLALSLVYEHGRLLYAATRGNGTTGEDITTNVRTMESVPLVLELHGKTSTESQKIVQARRVEVRGEAIISKTSFARINKDQKKREEKIYANSRNLAAGTLRQLDPKLVAGRTIDFFAYDLLVDGGPDRHSKEHEVLRELGFKTDPHAKVSVSLEEVFQQYNYISHIREKVPYEIDGVVVVINDNKIYEQLGVVGKAPRGAIAYKFAPKEAVTKVENIVVQVGRTGVLTPVAHLSPVQIGGVTVSRATLHNEDEIRRLGVKIGDSVIVGRAGDVIPDVRKVLVELRTGHEKTFHMPKRCPICGHQITKDVGGVIARCTNKSCPSLKRERIYYFVSKHAFDIDGLGPKTVDVLLDQSLIQDAADLYALQEGDIAPLERFGEKSAKNIIESIAASKKIDLSRFLVALGILHVGEETARDLAEHFGSLEELMRASLEKIVAVPNIGGVVARSIVDFFRDSHNRRFIEKLKGAGIKIGRAKPKKPGVLAGRSFVFTGELKTMTRDEAKANARALGADVSESVSKKTSYVVVGTSPGSKYEKAQKLGVRILSEKEFLKMIQ